MQIAILGPFEVRTAGERPVAVSGLRLRALLTRLALDAGRPVPVATLIAAVWGDAPPAEATNALQTLVSRARRAIGASALVAAPAGYHLVVAPDDVDALRFERLARDGIAAVRRGAVVEGGAMLREALALWRGPVEDEHAAARLGGLRLTVLVERIELDLATAPADVLVAELEELLRHHPLDERLTGQLVRALARAGRPADALARYEVLRRALADHLGVDPSAELQAVHVAVLRGEVAAEAVSSPRRSNLKAQLTSFVGRDELVRAIGKALAEQRLVTLVGPGGAGKTRLASEAAARLDAEDGVWLAELAPLTDGADVPQAVLGALGLRETHLLERTGPPRTGRDAVGRLHDVLAGKQVVLVLDNCEHVLDAAAGLAVDLLERCPGLRVLASSREALGVTGETLLAVPPLGHPRPGATAAEAIEHAAVRLFADRAAAVRPGFAVDDTTVADVVEIVRRLDGLPLAIELAAARLRTMALADVAARLSDRFRLLTGGSRTALPRHRTLRAVVEWSWDLLAAPERALAERLAVLPGGLTAASAAAICADASLPAADVPDLLASLVDRSLLQPVGDGRRLRMLETIREYGVERLAERGELAAARDRHADHFAALLRDSELPVISRDQLPWLEQLELERDNILAALRHRCDTGDAESALRIAVGLGGHAMIMGLPVESAGWLADALAVAGTESPHRWLARAQLALIATTGMSAPAVPGEPLRPMAELADALDDVPDGIHPVIGIVRTMLAFFVGDRARVDAIVTAELGRGTPWSRAAVRMFRAHIAENDGDIAGMRADTEQALAEFQALGERWGTASTLQAVGALRTLDGDLPGAVAAYEQARDLIAEMGSREDAAFLGVRLAELHLRAGDVDAARAAIATAEAGAEASGAPMEAIMTLTMRAAIEREAGRPDLARELQADASARSAALPPGHPVQGHLRALLAATSARVAWDDGDGALARRRATEAHAAGVGTDDLPLLATVGVVLAGLAVEWAGPEAAAEVLGACTALRGAPDPTDLEVRRVTATLTDLLGPDGLRTAYDRGRALDRSAAIARLDPAGWPDAAGPG